MNFKVLFVLLLIALISLDHSDAWRRRRRGGRRRRRSWFGKAFKKVGKVVKKGFKLVKKGVSHYGKYKFITGLWKDQETLDNIRTLKNQDQDSYLEFMENMKDAFENAYPDLDSEEFVEAVDNMVDMEPDEFEEMERLMENDEDINQEEVPDAFKHLDEDLAMRVATL